jgi:type VI secretion system protein ImpF
MEKSARDQRLQASVIDRLLADDMDSPGEPRARPAWSLEQQKAAVRRDLEWLLNSRPVVADVPEGPVQLRRSLLTYGLHDVASLNLNSSAAQERLRRDVAAAIARFEPRLTKVKVTLMPLSALDRSIRLRIDALLRVEPVPEPVCFDSVFSLDDRIFAIGDGPA